MKKLSDLLDNMPTPSLIPDTPNTQQLGLTKTDGQLTTPLNRTPTLVNSWSQLPDYLNNINPWDVSSSSIEIKDEWLPDILGGIDYIKRTYLISCGESQEGRNKLGACIAGVFASQKIYGTPMDKEALTGRKRMFIEILGEYPIEVIERAFVKYCRENEDIPAPSNIRELVLKDPNLSRHRSKVRSFGIMANRITGEEKEYIKTHDKTPALCIGEQEYDYD